MNAKYTNPNHKNIAYISHNKYNKFFYAIFDGTFSTVGENGFANRAEALAALKATNPSAELLTVKEYNSRYNEQMQWNWIHESEAHARCED